ncbi:MAG: hypothetical protein K0R50_1304 [Eubacterium sp.]|jgi:hypothetical protein|nr:hypothetical protein [Eubacterium sp.]
MFKKQKRDEVMKDILSTVGSCSIALATIYLIKKINDYLKSKEEGKKSYKFDKDDDFLE